MSRLEVGTDVTITARFRDESKASASEFGVRNYQQICSKHKCSTREKSIRKHASSVDIFVQMVVIQTNKHTHLYMGSSLLTRRAFFEQKRINLPMECLSCFEDEKRIQGFVENRFGPKAHKLYVYRKNSLKNRILNRICMRQKLDASNMKQKNMKVKLKIQFDKRIASLYAMHA